MRSRELIMIELETEHDSIGVLESGGSHAFQTNLQEAVLLSLLEKKLLTQRQYERCAEELLHSSAVFMKGEETCKG